MKTIAQELNITKFPFEIKDENGNRIYYENSDGYWFKQEWNSKGNRIYYENSDGYVEDERPKPTVELTLEDIAKLAGVSVEQIKIKK